jgi:hypothetical protein
MSDANPSWENLSVAVVLAQRSRDDKKALLEDLVEMLSGLGTNVEVRRALLRRHITSIRLVLGDHAYLLSLESNKLFGASRQQLVRGVAIKTTPMEIEPFLEELGLALDVELRRTEQGRQALQRWLGSGDR